MGHRDPLAPACDEEVSARFENSGGPEHVERHGRDALAEGHGDPA